MTPVFDSNIVIDFMRGVPQAVEELQVYDLRLISIITWIEAMVGCKTEQEEYHASDLLSKYFNVIMLESTIIDQAVLVRRSTRLKLPDAIIWATARVHNTLLITRNNKDFSPKDPSIRIPYRLR